MPSQFSWLDASEHDRRRALDVIDLFQQKETVDELGIGSIRDTLADVLTPGTSTVQTRARYFFFVPWIYQALEKRNSASERMSIRGRGREIAIIEPLAKSADPSGTIGIMARGSLRRLPSAVYWAGLGRLGFRLTPDSLDRHHRKADRGRAIVVRDDAGDLGVDAIAGGTWHPRLPPPPDDFPNAVNFALRRQESEFFRDQLRIKARGSLLHHLVEAGHEVSHIDVPWNSCDRSDISGDLVSMLDDGQRYSELMHGAQLLYNLMLSEKRKHKDWITRYTESLVQWKARAAPRMEFYQTWNRQAFWSLLQRANGYLPAGARLFSEQWIELVLGRHADIVKTETARRLISDREQRMKGARARLVNPDQLNLWGGASGSAQLDYRWGITQTVVNDIVRGLQA